MSSLEADEVLFAYIAVAPHAVSLVLVRDDNEIQRPVYYVSKSLHEAEVCYLPLEKAILVVVHATRKLPHYFQAHMVIGEAPITREESPCGARSWVLLTLNTCLGPL